MSKAATAPKLDDLENLLLPGVSLGEPETKESDLDGRLDLMFQTMLGAEANNQMSFQELKGTDAYKFFGITDAFKEMGRLRPRHVEKIRQKVQELARGNDLQSQMILDQIRFRVWRPTDIDVKQSIANKMFVGVVLPNQFGNKEETPIRYGGDLHTGKRLTAFFPMHPTSKDKEYAYVVELVSASIQEDLL